MVVYYTHLLYTSFSLFLYTTVYLGDHSITEVDFPHSSLFTYYSILWVYHNWAYFLCFALLNSAVVDDFVFVFFCIFVN